MITIKSINNTWYFIKVLDNNLTLKPQGELTLNLAVLTESQLKDILSLYNSNKIEFENEAMLLATQEALELKSDEGVNEAEVAVLIENKISQTTPQKRQIILTRGVFPTLVNNASNGNYTRYETHLFATTGDFAATNIQLHFTSFRSHNAEDTTLNINDFNLQCAFVYNNQFCPVSFNGMTTTPIQAGVTELISNAIGTYVPARTEVKIKTGAIVGTANQATPAMLPQTQKTKKVASNDTVSQIFSRFDINNTSRVDTTLGYFPSLVTGIPETNHVSIIGWGDSLMAGTGDTPNNANGAMGWFEHGCLNTDGLGKNIPYANFSKAGDESLAYDNDEAFGRYAMLKYASHVIFGLGNNDIATRSLEAIKTSHREAWAHAKLLGLKVGVVTLTPRTDSADSWTTVANQTPRLNYDSTGTRGLFNAWLFEQVDLGNVDFIIDVDSIARDPSNPDVFKPNFSYDGVHWTAASTLIIAAYAKTIIDTLTYE